MAVSRNKGLTELAKLAERDKKTNNFAMRQEIMIFDHTFETSVVLFNRMQHWKNLIINEQKLSTYLPKPRWQQQNRCSVG